MKKAALIACLVLSGTAAVVSQEIQKADEPADPYLWLEEVKGERALAWVNEKNSQTLAVLESDPRFEPHVDAIVAEGSQKNPALIGDYDGGYFYNITRGQGNPFGAWRRSKLASFQSDSPEWETLFDASLAVENSGERQFLKSVQCAPGKRDRCLIALSAGGGDAVMQKEFSTKSGDFVEGGFELPADKASFAWLGKDTILIASSVLGGDKTDAGYPRTLRIWRRGQPLEDAQALFSIPKQFTLVSVQRFRIGGQWMGLIKARETLFKGESYLVNDRGFLMRLPIPETADVIGSLEDQLVFKLTADWSYSGSNHEADTILSLDSKAYLNDGITRLSTVYKPAEKEGIAVTTFSKDRIYLTIQKDVVTRLEFVEFAEGKWRSGTVNTPVNGAAFPRANVDSDLALVYYTDFKTPLTIFSIRDGQVDMDLVKAPGQKMDMSGFVIEQSFAISADGTSVPYFLIRSKDMKFDGSTPVFQTGYGGFRLSLGPNYLGYQGRQWLKSGGAYVVANVRGGGEYGAEWHQAATKENKQRSYDDFTAISDDLVRRGVTSPGKIAIQGSSNGGLLMGAAFTQRPDLYGAVISMVPLLDMRRFSVLLAGASWVGEYGDPDKPEDWAYIRKYSPYHNVHADRRYPKVFFVTSTEDDRVHPAHARKMAAKMIGQGHEIMYFENREGGHGAAANARQGAKLTALQLVYLLQQMFDDQK